MDVFRTGVISLIKSALMPNEDKLVLPDDFDWDAAVELGVSHQIIPMLYYGIANTKLNIPAEAFEKLQQKAVSNVITDTKQLFEVARISEAFSENKIDHMPLKGALLKHLYPRSEMRSMGDIDILIRVEQYDKIRIIMEKLGYTEMQESDHELVWQKGKLLHVELHKRLIPSGNTDLYGYFGDGWDFAVPNADNPYCFSFIAIEQYIYLVTHFVKHYRDKGIGIKHLTDLFIFLSANPEIKQKDVISRLKKLELDVFYKNVYHTLNVWFNNEKSDEMSDFITDKIFESGAFGTDQTRHLSHMTIMSNIVKSPKLARWKNLLMLTFPSYKIMCHKYGFLKKLPFLLPIMWIVRIFNALIFKRDVIRSENAYFKEINASAIQNHKDDLKYVGLSFDIKKL